MNEITTPIRNSKKHAPNPVMIPPSPFLKKLGYGTGVTVYKLERSPIANQTRSPWAIKKLSKTNVASAQYGKRLIHEATILRQLNHPHIVGFRAFTKNQDNQDCLIMEECDISLGDMIEDRRDLGLPSYPAINVMKVALDISQALHYLHSQVLLLHCDVKSYNVLVEGNFNICKLCDFGVTLPLTSSGEVDYVKAGKKAEYVGTRLWCAPEVLRDPQVVTSKADVFSFGLVLWEMLALIPPCLDEIDESACSTADLDASNDSHLNESGKEAGFGKRPELPEQEFGDSYKYVLELFYCCTEENPLDRPSAQDLTISIPEMIKATA